ncbi:MAG: hypothetical protein AB4060_14965 [Crocosphaera sp.]
MSLKAFQRDDADFFFGRDKIIEELLKKLENREQERLVGILGASGSGKSSVMRAGLLDELKKGQKILGSKNWKIIDPFNPTNKPLEVLQKKLTAAEFKKIDADRPIIIMVDQFEECFTFCDKQTRKDFINKLLELLEDKPNLQITLTMRSDFRSRLVEFEEFWRKMSKVEVKHPEPEDIEKAIIEPANKVGLYIYPALTNQLVNDVKDYQGSLPLFEYTLTELWKEAQKKGETSLRLETYNQLGGIERTLQNRATKIYESLSKADQAVAKRIFLALVQPGDIADTRRRMSLGDLKNSRHDLDTLDRVTDFLANENNRLLTRTNIDQKDNTLKQYKQEDPKNKIVIEVVHEALISNWNLLGEWKQQYREAMISERRIEDAAQQWDKGNGNLYQPKNLRFANIYREKHDELGMLSGLAEQFIEESRKDVIWSKWSKTAVSILLVSLFLSIFSLSKYTDQNKQIAVIKEQSAIAQKKLPRAKDVKPLIFVLDAVAKNKKLNNSLLSRLETCLENGLQPKSGLMSEVHSILIGAVHKNLNSIFIKDNYGFPSMAVSSDGQYLVFGSYKTVKLWDVQSQTLIDTFKGHQGWVTSIAFSPDNKHIVSGSYDNTIKLWDWDINSKKLIHTFEGHEDWVNSVAFSPDGKYLVSGSNDNTVKLWNVQDKKLIHTFKGHQDSVNSVAFSPNKKDQYIVSGSDDKTVKRWDVQSKKLIHSFEGHQNYVNSVAFSPDGQYIVSGSKDKTVKLWNIKDKKLIDTFEGHEDWVNSVAFSPDGQYLLSGSYDNTLRRWTTDRQSQFQAQSQFLTFLRGHQDYVNSIVLSANGQYLVSGSYDNTVKLWNVQSQKLIHSFEGHEDDVKSVAFSPNGHYIVSGSDDTTVKLWDVQSKTLIHTFKGHKDWVNSVAFSPNKKDQYIVSGSDDNTVKLWDVQSKTLIYTFEGHEVWVNSVAFSRDGQYIVSGSDDNTVKLWNIKDKTLIYTFEGHEDWVNSVAFSPNKKDQYIVSGSDDNTVKLWNIQSKDLEHTFYDHEGWVNSVAFSIDGKYLVSGNADGIVILWDVQSKKILYSLYNNSLSNEDSINSVAFSPDGEYILFGSNNSTVRILPSGTDIKWQEWVKPVCYGLHDNPYFISTITHNPSDLYRKALPDAIEICKNESWTDEQEAHFLLKQGLAIAKQGELRKVQEKFEEVEELISKEKLDRQEVYNDDSVENLFSTGKLIAKRGLIEEAIFLYKKAENLNPNPKDYANYASSLNTLCRFGSLYNNDDEYVLNSCDKAVDKASDYQKPFVYDSRGLARALNKDRDGAIEDFEVYVKDKTRDENLRKQRQQWIDELEKGTPIDEIFTDEVLKDLKNE